MDQLHYVLVILEINYLVILNCVSFFYKEQLTVHLNYLIKAIVSCFYLWAVDEQEK